MKNLNIPFGSYSTEKAKEPSQDKNKKENSQGRSLLKEEKYIPRKD